MRRFRLLYAALLCAVAQRGTAQAVVSGYVYDSLRTKAALVDASVVITELNLFTTTDASGHFTFAQRIPAGTWSVTFLHPVLDSLSIAAPTQQFVVADTSAPLLRLSTPSPSDLVRRVCPNAEPETGLVLGTVRDATTGLPVPGAQVQTEWVEVELHNAMRRNPRSATTRTLATGAYVLCFVPTDISTELRASRDSARTGPVEIFLNDRVVLRRDFVLNLDGSGRTALSGIVRAANGKPAADAAVSVGPGIVSTRTDAQGRYALPNAPAGTQLIEARVIGARPVRMSVDLEAEIPKRVDIDFTTAVVELPMVAISGKQTARGRFAEFAERQKTGLGQYITADEIERRQPADMLSLLSRAGLTYSMSRDGKRNLLMRGSSSNNCAPTYFVDGIRWMGGTSGAGGAMSGGATGGTSAIEDLSNFFRPEEIRAVEIYKGFGSIPTQYDPANGCGVVLIWTR